MHRHHQADQARPPLILLAGVIRDETFYEIKQIDFTDLNIKKFFQNIDFLDQVQHLKGAYWEV